MGRQVKLETHTKAQPSLCSSLPTAVFCFSGRGKQPTHATIVIAGMFGRDSPWFSFPEIKFHKLQLLQPSLLQIKIKKIISQKTFESQTRLFSSCPLHTQCAPWGSSPTRRRAREGAGADSFFRMQSFTDLYHRIRGLRPTRD